jgi:hypothetical protein
VALGARPRSGPRPVVIAARGGKVYGEGECKVRLQGWSKRRTWRKLPLGVDAAPGAILGAVASEAGVSDDAALPDRGAQVKGELDQVRADGASDKRRGYEVRAARGAKAVIPPRRDAKSWQQGNCTGAPWQRDENLGAIRRQGRRQWKQEAGYQRRSVAGTTFFRGTPLLGPPLRACAFPQQATELFIKAAALNRMTHLGMPDSYRLAP